MFAHAAIGLTGAAVLLFVACSLRKCDLRPTACHVSLAFLGAGLILLALLPVKTLAFGVSGVTVEMARQTQRLRVLEAVVSEAPPSPSKAVADALASPSDASGWVEVPKEPPASRTASPVRSDSHPEASAKAGRKHPVTSNVPPGGGAAPVAAAPPPITDAAKVNTVVSTLERDGLIETMTWEGRPMMRSAPVASGTTSRTAPSLPAEK
jgi:hypothetical protein